MSVVDLNGIKTGITTLLNNANTTTGIPIDLSNGLSSRVNKVLQVNVEKIPIQPSFFPCITMFYDSKDITNQDMAGSMLVGRKRAELDLKIVGIIWSDNISTANFDINDLADNDCEILMENIEQVLRQDPTIGGRAIRATSTDVSYHTFTVSEATHMRAGILTHKITVQY